MAGKIGIIVQRYGLEINGGAEYHARLIAEKLSKYYRIEVFTSTALDYITWDHHYPEKTEEINNIPINRFKASRPRDPQKFGKIQEIVFNQEHHLNDEIKWLEEEGPMVPELLDELGRREKEFDFYIFFSYRYYHSYYGVKKFSKKAILVPTAEHDEVLYMRLFKDFFHAPAAFIYNSHEEKEIINRISDNHHVLGDIVGVGSELPDGYEPIRFRKKHNIDGPYFVYIGRLDENKGIPELFDYYTRFLTEQDSKLTLVLMGKTLVDIPDHTQIKYLGFVDDQDKFDGLGGAEFLIIPSQYESLSMVTLEAWGLGKPVIANGRTEVLQGQCRRSNAGLWYFNYDEFKEIMTLMSTDENLKQKMGKNGEEFFQKNYSWPVIENKYIQIINQLLRR